MSAGAGWSQGYVTDVNYTNSFFRELSPAWLNHVAMLNGAHPRPLDDGFNHIDLGCGLGQSVNVLAACFPRGNFYGVDFNPAHIDTAQHLARQLGIDNAHFIEQAFEELLEVDLPSFDFITLHGIYSWIGDETRQAVQRFIYKKLKPGGIVYNSYNCLPGWTNEAPIRRLLLEFGQTHHGDSASRVEKAAKDAEEMAALKLGYFRANPSAADQVGKLTKRATNYLAHEYLNASWNTFYSADVADEMAGAKLTYLGSATLMENHLELMMPDPAVAYCKKQPTDRLRQLAQDFLIGQRFRRDVYVRGHPRLQRSETSRHLQHACFALPGSVDDFSDKTKVPRGEISFDQKSAQQIKEALTKGSLSLEQIIETTGANKRNVQELERTLLLMCAVGKLVPVGTAFQPSALPAKPERVRIVDSINRRLVELGRQAVTRQYLVAPAVGAGIMIDALDAVALALLEEGTPTTKLAAAVGEELKTRGIRVNKDGAPITDEKEAAAKTGEIIYRFLSRALPTLMRYGVVETA